MERKVVSNGLWLSNLDIVDVVQHYCPEKFIRPYSGPLSMINQDREGKRANFSYPATYVHRPGGINHFARIKVEEGKASYFDPFDRKGGDVSATREWLQEWFPGYEIHIEIPANPAEEQQDGWSCGYRCIQKMLKDYGVDNAITRAKTAEQLRDAVFSAMSEILNLPVKCEGGRVIDASSVRSTAKPNAKLKAGEDPVRSSKRVRFFVPEKVTGSLSKRADFYPSAAAEWDDPAGQALRIFNLLQKELNENSGQKIGLLYAANNDQALALRDSQLIAGKSIAAINGSGQALLFAELVKLINKNKLMDRIHILPMSTSMHGGNNAGKNAVSTAIIDRDVNYAENHIKAGFKVYGVPRMNKDGSLHADYAIGGGVSKAWLEVTFPELGGRTQNQYLQEKLNGLEKKYNHAKKATAAPTAKGTPVAKAATPAPAKAVPATNKKKPNPFAVPAFKARFKNDPKEYVIKITDHEPVVMFTAAGLLVSLNIWCPGSAISPSLNPSTSKFGALEPQYQLSQMNRMAHYLFEMAKDGVQGFMLQEVPDANSNAFKMLNNQLAALCNKYNSEKSEIDMPINLVFQHWARTPAPGRIARGVCALVNVHALSLVKKPKPSADPAMDNLFDLYCVTDKENPEIKFDIYNIHADFNFQQETAEFVGECVAKKAMVCGDLNISARSPIARALKKQIPDGDHNYSWQGEGGTLDCFFDAYTPSLAPKVKPKVEPDPKGAKTPGEPLAATKSVLTAEPKAEPKAEVTSYLDPAPLKLIQAKLKELKWSVEAHTDRDGNVHSATAKKGTETIKIAKQKFSTQSKDVETFKAMLEAFKAVHPDKAPSVSVEAEAMKKLWEQAYKAVYPGSPVPDNFVRMADKKEEDKPEPRAPSPRMGR
jgi:hypothetical protein